VKKLKKITIWSGLVLYFILISGFVSGKREAMLCNKVDIVISDSSSKRFLEKHDITDLLIRNNLLSLGTNIASVNTSMVEEVMLGNSLIKQCNVYTTIDGALNIDLWQREPVVRIIDNKGKSYYLDLEGSVIAMSKRFTPHLLVVNGNIKTPFNPQQIENIYHKKYNKSATTLRQIHRMALFIRGHDFWNAQVVQMYVDEKKEFEIVPRIGPHLIQLGPSENFEAKLEKLKVFYKEGLNKVGWNQYLKINLKYKDQIVCSKL
jgi:cell division protein FtsQ